MNIPDGMCFFLIIMKQKNLSILKRVAKSCYCVYILRVLTLAFACDHAMKLIHLQINKQKF